jgi:hypothetical protein
MRCASNIDRPLTSSRQEEGRGPSLLLPPAPGLGGTQSAGGGGGGKVALTAGGEASFHHEGWLQTETNVCSLHAH